MRVTSTTSYITMRQGLAASLQAVADAQSALSSGKRINNFSDAPSDAVAVLRYSSQEADVAAFQHAANDGSGWVATADGALQSVSSTLQRVTSLAVSAVNGGLGATSRGAIADEVTALRDQLVDVANTKVGSRGLFSGFQDTAVAKVAGAWAYTGDTGAVTRQVGPAANVQVNVTGDSVFGFAAGPGQDLFSTLDALATAIRSGNTAGIASAQNLLGARSDDVSRSLGTLGAAQNRIENQVDIGSANLIEIKKQRSNLEDIDIAEAALKMQMVSTGYQAALAAAGKADLPSLADFLR
jgi:flagellar hook-associated protein 3 FlgL